MSTDKFHLLRDVHIKVYWIDPISDEEKSGELWNYSWVDSILSSTEVEVKLYEWFIKGDDGGEYVFPENELYLDSKLKVN